MFEVATPYGAVNFDQPGLYNVGFDNNGGVLVSVLSGLARVVGLGGSGEVSKGEMLTLVGQAASEIALSRLNRRGRRKSGRRLLPHINIRILTTVVTTTTTLILVILTITILTGATRVISMRVQPFRASTIWIITATGRMLTVMAMPGDRGLIQAGFPISRASGPTIIRMGQPGFPVSPGAMRLIIMDVGPTLVTSGTGFPRREHDAGVCAGPRWLSFR